MPKISVDKTGRGGVSQEGDRGRLNLLGKEERMGNVWSLWSRLGEGVNASPHAASSWEVP